MLYLRSKNPVRDPWLNPRSPVEPRCLGTGGQVYHFDFAQTPGGGLAIHPGGDGFNGQRRIRGQFNEAV